MSFYHKHVNNNVPLFCILFFSYNAPHPDYHTRHNMQLVITYSHTSRARKSVRYHLPSFLRSMPQCVIENIDRVQEFNFLGTIIHVTLEWTHHIDKVANKISRTLGIFNNLKALPVYTLRPICSALSVPHFNYNILQIKVYEVDSIWRQSVHCDVCVVLTSNPQMLLLTLNLIERKI